MTTTAEPRILIETPAGSFAPGDPRAAQAIADYVRSEVTRDLEREQVKQVNAALILAPQEGVCTRCQRRLPLFLFRCEHWEVFGFSHAHNVWLCTRDWSDFQELEEDDRDPCDSLPTLPDDWDAFTAEVPGTTAWIEARKAAKAAVAVPPIPASAKVHAAFGPPMPGVGKSLAGALVENDGSVEPETTPAVAK